MDESGTQRTSYITPFMKQLYSTISAVLMVIGAVGAVSFPAIAIPQLEKENGDIQTDPSTISWIGSMGSLAMPFGCIFGGWSIERFGRKRSQQICAIPITIGWIVIAFSNGLAIFLLGRFLTGISLGIQFAVTSVYIGEASSPKNRDFLMPFVSLFFATGIFLCHLFGTYFHWKTVSMIWSTFSILSAVMISFAPETPSWFVSKSKMEKAAKSFAWYRGQEAKEMEELTSMIDKKLKQNIETQNSEPGRTYFSEKVKYFRTAFTTREFIVPMIIILNFFVILQFSGNTVMFMYVIQVIRVSVGNKADSYIIMLCLDALRVVTAILACFILKYCRRRPTALIGVGVTCLALIAMSLHLFLTKKGIISDDFFWLPITYLVVIVGGIAIGINALTFSMLGELFPLRFKGLGASFATVFGSIMSFLSAKTAPLMFESCGMDGTFLFFAGVTLVALVTIYKTLPETKGKTLLQIEEFFASKAEKS